MAEGAERHPLEEAPEGRTNEGRAVVPRSGLHFPSAMPGSTAQKLEALRRGQGAAVQLAQSAPKTFARGFPFQIRFLLQAALSRSCTLRAAVRGGGTPAHPHSVIQPSAKLGRSAIEGRYPGQAGVAPNARPATRGTRCIPRAATRRALARRDVRHSTDLGGVQPGPPPAP